MDIPFFADSTYYQHRQTLASGNDHPDSSSQCPTFSDYRYKFQSSDDSNNDFSATSSECMWSNTCPLAGYYIAKEDNEASKFGSNNSYTSVNKIDTFEPPSYLDLNTWNSNTKLDALQYYQVIESEQSLELFEKRSSTNRFTEFVPDVSSSESMLDHAGCNLESDNSHDQGTGAIEDSSSFEDETDSYESASSNDGHLFTNTALSEEKKNSPNGTCVICGDCSRGFHYKVMACEGCKGFFRRSVEKNTTYKCHRNNCCQINKVTRNRCQACRFKKCLQMGMYKESVRRDRCNKRKRRNSAKVMDDVLMPRMEDTLVELVQEVVQAHRLTYISTDIRSDSWNQVCNDVQDNKDVLWNESSDLSRAGILRVISFSKKIPGFMSLCIQDQITLLRNSCIEIMMLRMCTRYFPELDGFHFYNGISVSRLAMERHLGPLARLMVEMAESLIRLSVDDTELSLMQALCLLSSERPGLKYRQQVQYYEEQVSAAIMMHACKRRLTRPLALHEIIKTLFNLRVMGRTGSGILMLPSYSQ